MHTTPLYIASLFALAYVLLLCWYAWGWVKMPVFALPPECAPTQNITVLVPFFNEEGCIVDCLTALHRNDYPKALTEVLLLDDGSTDRTVALVQAWLAEHPNANIKLLRLPKAGKKAAITAGIKAANGAYIVCTDADCTPPTQWLSWVAAALAQPRVQLVAGPVVFKEERGLMDWFQSLDLLGLMGITGSGIYLQWQRMANGANLAYKKAAFDAVGGFEGHAHIASGDDLFLVQKIAARWPKGIFFLKNHHAAVPTRTMPSLKKFVRQRIRWGSKNAALPEWPVRLSLLLVFLTCWVILLLAIGTCFHPAAYQLPCAIVLSAKLFADYLFLNMMSRFFQKTTAMRWFLPAQLGHIVYIACIGFASLWATPKSTSNW